MRGEWAPYIVVRPDGIDRYRTMYGGRCRMSQIGFTKKHIRAKCQLWQLKRKFINACQRPAPIPFEVGR